MAPIMPGRFSQTNNAHFTGTIDEQAFRVKTIM
jgi:hypothetical protein